MFKSPGFLCFITLVAIGIPQTAFAEYLCSWVREPIYFSLISSASKCTKKFDEQIAVSVETIHFKLPTKDGFSLGGVKLKPKNRESKGRILVAQGNAHRVNDLVPHFMFFAKNGYEVIMYDYRGYDLSPGSAGTVKTNFEDYRAVISKWNSGDVPVFIYAMSWGGIVMLNSLSGDENISTLILDSVPDEIPHLGCPDAFDPKSRIEKMKIKTVLIVSGKDRVFKREEQADLIKIVSKNPTWSLIEYPDFDHPFTCGLSQERRLTTIMDAIQHE